MASSARVRTIGGLSARQSALGATPVGNGPIRSGRDLRIDVIRGLALWMIFFDHVPADVFGRYTYGHFALADALDIFIFLSGLSCAALYGRLVRTAGVPRAQARALRRAGQLYAANICLALVVVGFYFAFRHRLEPDYVTTYDLSELAAEPLRAVAAMVGLAYTPQMTDILPLYMALVVATPGLFWLMERSEAMALALSAALWLAAAVDPRLNIPSLGMSGVASFNPFSWQLLFCVGLWAGKRLYVDGVLFRPRRWLIAVCWLAVVAGLVLRHSAWLGYTEPHVAWLAAAAESRVTVDPARLANLLAWAYLVAAYLPADSRWLGGRWASPLRLCGRHSLEVFCTGVAFSVAGIVAVRTHGEGLAVQVAVNGAGIAAMLGVAWLAERRRVRSQLSLGFGDGHAVAAKEHV